MQGSQDGCTESLDVQEGQLSALADLCGVKGQKLGGGDFVLLESRDECSILADRKVRQDPQEIRHGADIGKQFS